MEDRSASLRDGNRTELVSLARILLLKLPGLYRGPIEAISPIETCIYHVCPGEDLGLSRLPLLLASDEQQVTV